MLQNFPLNGLTEWGESNAAIMNQVQKFSHWKQKERVLRIAREKKPKGIMFYPDMAKRTLDRRTEQIPDLIEERKKGKIAYFVMDQLVVRDKEEPRDLESNGTGGWWSFCLPTCQKMKMNTTAGELVATSCGCCMLSRCVLLISMGIFLVIVGLYFYLCLMFHCNLNTDD